jgi:hypothetical protein
MLLRCKVQFCYHLVLGPLFWECPLLGALSCTWPTIYEILMTQRILIGSRHLVMKGYPWPSCLGIVTDEVNNLHLMRSRYPKLPIRERYQWPLANSLVLVKVDELSLMFWGGDNFISNLDWVNIIDYHSCYYEQIVILSSFLRDLVVQSKSHFRSRLSRWASSFFCWWAW